jgi:hypothetical protein
VRHIESSLSNALLQKRPETMLVLTKAAGHTWPTAEAIFKMRARLGVPHDLDECLAGFDHLQRAIAERVLQLLRRGQSGRSWAAASGSGSVSTS